MQFFMFAILVGLVLLVWSSDRFVVGASVIARNLGISPLLIGLTIVAIGTSAPEILVSALSAIGGNPGLAIGNAFGSNIANIGLVLGVAALVSPLRVNSGTLKRELPLMLVVMALVGALMLDYSLDLFDGVVLLVASGVLLGLMIVIGLKARATDPMEEEYKQEMPTAMSNGRALFWLIVGSITLLASSRAVVWGAVGAAQALGVSDVLIGLTIVAIGTSLPELAASITSALKGEHDIAIGNVIGSNMFNLLPVLGLPAAISPGAFPPEVFNRDFVVMFALGVALLIMAYGFRGPGRLNRWEGATLVCVFAAYQGFLYWSVTGS